MRLPFILFCFLCVGHFSLAQQFVRHTLAEPDLWLPQCIALADMDGDGDRDVVMNSQGRRNLVWYANNGSGGFGQMNIIYAAPSWIDGIVNHFEVGDVDGDGDMDIASVWDTDHRTVWHANNGLGVFSSQPIAIPSIYYRSVHLMDADGDGDQEVFTALFDPPYMYKYTYNGGGVFSPASTVGTNYIGSPRSLHSQDIDGDGDRDLIFTGTSYAYYRLNNGSGTFGAAIQTCSSQSGGPFHTDDVDGDGDLDAITTYNNAVWLRRTAWSLFDTPLLLLSGALPRLIRTADLDQDGDRDIVLVRDCDLLWLPNNGNGTFGAAQAIDAAQGGSWAALGDLNGDALPDLVVIGKKEPSIYLNNGGGAFTAPTAISLDQAVFIGGNAVDMNGDGLPDVLTRSHIGVEIHPNLGQGVFGQHLTAVHSSLYPSTSAYADMDLDGDLDVVTTAFPSCTPTSYNVFQIAMNNGAGVFSLPATFPAPSGQAIRSMALADMDQDGDSDVVVTTIDTMFVYLYNGISLQKVQSIPHVITTFKLGDLDADGDPDVLLGVDGSGALQWRQNNGQGILTTNALNSTTSPSRHFMDMDGDGDLDAITAVGTLIVAMRNNGTTSFVATDTLGSTGTTTMYMHDGDLDGDGDPDLVVGRGAGLVGWYANTGNGTFGPLNTLIPTSQLYEDNNAVRVQVVDLDDDGDQDVLTGANLVGRLEWLENKGLRFAVRVILEGPYVSATGLMNDSLRKLPSFPLSQPFTALGFTNVAAGSISASVLTTTGANAIVDWVLVELRDKNNSALVTTAVPALLQRDGDIVALDGLSPLWIDRPADSYYVAIRHRNHLGVMTQNTVSLNGTVAALDLTNGSVALYGTAAQKQVGAVKVCWAGNVVPDTQLKYTGGANDRDPILLAIGGGTPTATISGYHSADCNLDAVVKYTGAVNDRDLILVNIGGGTPTLTRVEQLP